MTGRLEEFQRNTAFVVAIILCVACCLYVTGQIRSTLIPIVWAAFFAMPLTMLIASLDALIVRSTSWLLNKRRGNESLESEETFEFTAALGESNVRMARSPALEAFLHKVNKPCSCSPSLPSWILGYCRRRVKLVKLHVETTDGTQVSLGPEVNRLVEGWEYYIAEPVASSALSEDDHASLQIPLASAGADSSSVSGEIAIGLFLDHAGQYPAVIPQSSAEDGVRLRLTGHLRVDKTSSVSWTLAFLIALAIVSLCIAVFVWMIVEGVRSFTNDLDTYKKGIDSLVNWIKPIIPADIWQTLQERAQKFGSEVLPALASVLAGMAETVGYQSIFFLIYLFFWLFEPLPISGHVMKVFKSYLFLKTLVCILFASLMSAMLAILQCELWPLLFVVFFLLNYIPEVGAIACAALSVPVVLLNGNFTVPFRLSQLVWLVIGGTLIKIFTGNVIEVHLYATQGGQFMRMHPVILLAMIMVCSAVLGVTGAFLSVPILAAVKYCLLSSSMPDTYLNPLLVFIEGDETGPHRNFVDRRRPEGLESARTPSIRDRSNPITELMAGTANVSLSGRHEDEELEGLSLQPNSQSDVDTV